GPAAAALDVVAHEFTHGLIFHTANLGGEGETGALAEAIADLFGCFVSLGTVPGGDWQIGETVYRPWDQPVPLRDLARPHETANPERLSEWVAYHMDQGGVHHNSTIVSHAGYLMSEALGPEAAARIWYRTLSRYLTSQADFADAADATLVAA